MTDDCHNSGNVKMTPDNRSVMDALCLWNGQSLQLAESPIVEGDFYDTTSATWKVDDTQLNQDLEQLEYECFPATLRLLGDFSSIVGSS